MSFSWSAPQFTKEDERRERESLTEDERSQIQADIFGRGPTIRETSNLLADRTDRYHNALALLPASEKAAYLIALERCPHLVRTETNPLLFLRADNYNAEAAAKRLALNWEWRRRLFGESAWLAMSQQGALSHPTDQQTLNLALVSVQPNDNHGRAVMYWRRSEMRMDIIERESLLRVIFYVCHRAMFLNESAQRQGVVFLYDIRGLDIAKAMDRKLSKMVHMIPAQVSPLKVRVFHFCMSSTGKSIYNIVLPVMKHIMPRHQRLRTVEHSKCDSALIDDMEKYGISHASLPAELGGTYKTEDFLAWLSEREASGTRQTALRQRQAARAA